MASNTAVLSALKIAEQALVPLATQSLSLVEQAAVLALHSLMTDLVDKMNKKTSTQPSN
jgi:hypothetical protein